MTRLTIGQILNKSMAEDSKQVNMNVDNTGFKMSTLSFFEKGNAFNTSVSINTMQLSEQH